MEGPHEGPDLWDKTDDEQDRRLIDELREWGSTAGGLDLSTSLHLNGPAEAEDGATSAAGVSADSSK
eukprot:4592258-Pyramimonas_sp.AAC.1